MATDVGVAKRLVERQGIAARAQARDLHVAAGERYGELVRGVYEPAADSATAMVAVDRQRDDACEAARPLEVRADLHREEPDDGVFAFSHDDPTALVREPLGQPGLDLLRLMLVAELLEQRCERVGVFGACVPGPHRI